MATQAKFYRNVPLLIQPQTWTLLTYEKSIRNDRSMCRDLSVIMPPFDGDFIWSRNIRWAAITVPEGDVRPRQIMSRFIRDPQGLRDDTGAADHLASPGRNWETTTWQFHGEAYEPVGVEVWHDHDVPWAVEHAQFVATTWDY
jgi:hypothetical protein